MLRSVRIQGFKSLQDVRLELGSLNLLVGPNNAGKSSVLQAIQFAVSVAQSLELDGAKNWDRLGVRSGTLATQQLVFSPLRDAYALATGGALRQKSNPISIGFTDDAGEATVEVSRGKNRNIAVRVRGDALGKRMSLLEEPFSVLAPGLAGIPSIEEFRSRGIVRRAAARGDANSVFRNVLLALSEDASAWADFGRLIDGIFPGRNISVEFEEASDEDIKVWVTHGDLRLPIDAAGTGLLQAIQVLSYALLYRPSLLILDEPDSHLHPDNQRLLARLLQEIADELSVQVLVSTHSRHLLDEFNHIGANVVWMTSGKVESSDPARLEVLLSLGALDVGDRLRGGSLETVVITEDAKTKGIRAICESSGLVGTKVDFWSYPGCTTVAAAQTLARFIKEHSAGTKVVIHRDRDYLDDGELAAFEQAMIDVGAIPLLTRGTDIESHLLDVDHLRWVFPALSQEEIGDILERATADTMADSERLLINARNEQAVKASYHGGPRVEPGRIAQLAREELQNDVARYRHGKKTLKRVLTILQDEHGLSADVAVASPRLEIAALREISS